MPEAETCQWCCSRMPVRRRRGAERHFCTTPCRRAYDKASRRLGQSVAEADFRDPGELRTWFGEARAPRSEVKSAPEGSPPTEKAPAPPERPYGFCQHGLFWYVTNSGGQRVSDALKTAVQAKQLARQMTEKVARNPDLTQPLAR